MFYKFETLRVQNFQKLIVSDLSEMKKNSLVLSAVGPQATRANLVPSLQGQEIRLLPEDVCQGSNGEKLFFPTGVNPACFHLFCGTQTQGYLVNRRPC